MRTTNNNTDRTKMQQLLASIGSRHTDASKNMDAAPYDWYQPHCFNGPQMKKVSAFAAKVATSLAAKFGVLCQKSSEVAIVSTSEHFSAQFIGQGQTDQDNKSKGPVNYYLPFSTGQEEACGFVSIPPQTALMWTTQLLGDTETKENTTRPLSDLETSLLFDMAKLIVDAISAAAEKTSFKSVSNAVMDCLPLQLKGTEEFLKITFNVKKQGTETTSEAHILILSEKLIPLITDTGQAAGKFSDKEIARAIQNHIEKISVPITVQLATVAVTVEEALNLSPGDILMLDKKIDEPVHLLVSGKPIFRGRCAKSAGNYAIAITEPVVETTQS
ncbi:MAG: FliM/FliN family flagellar motor switch protein [Sedimentisphaerales bacterium]